MHIMFQREGLAGSGKGVFIWRRAGHTSPLGGASPLCRDPALNSLSKFVFVYIRRASLLRGTSLLTNDYQDLKRAGPPRRASKSKLRTHDKGCLDQHFLDKVFHFTSSVCICVGYKMKTCMQISDFRFRGRINVVSPGDLAKRASPAGRRAGFSQCKREVKSRPLGRASSTKRAGPPPGKHLLNNGRYSCSIGTSEPRPAE